MRIIRAFLTIVLATAVNHAIAIPAKREAVKVQQPDGTFVTITLHGDEWTHYTTTEDGYTVKRNQKGYYVYAEELNGILKETSVTAHDAAQRTSQELAFLSKTAKQLMPKMADQALRAKQAVEQRETQKRAARRAAQYDYNKFKGLIILISYNDKDFSREDYRDILTDMVNKENYTGFDREQYTGSVRDYFSDNSGGKFKPQFDVVGPYQVDFSYLDAKGGYQWGDDGYDGTETARIITQAVEAADEDVDFSQYDGDGDGIVDMIYFIVAGNGANYGGNDKGLWWPHRSVIIDPNNWNYIIKDNVYLYDYASSTELAGYTSYPSTVKIDGIGTICHEFSHVLGLPDFYDTDYERSGGTSNHPGQWSVMSGGSYENDGRTPVGYSLYERWAVGFTDNDPEVITSHGDYTLQPVHSTLSGYRIDTPVENEYFLLENRQKGQFKWDAYLPGSGMLVHRVDFTNEAVWDMNGYRGNTVNCNPSHNYYEVVRAGGIHRSNGEYVASAADVFPGSNNVRELSNGTSPASLKTWSGEDNEFGLTDIRMSNGVISFTVGGYELRGLSLPETLEVGIGLTKQLEATAEPSYAKYTLTWTSSDETVATVNETGTVTGIAEGTCVVTATSDNGITASCTVTVHPTLECTIAEFKQLPTGENAILKLDRAEVLYAYTKSNVQRIYLRDATGAIMLYNTNLNIQANDIVSGSVLVQSGLSNKVPQALGLGSQTDGSALTIEAGSGAEPREVRIDELTEADYSDLIVIKGVQVKRESSTYWAYGDENEVRVYTGNFGISSGLSSSMATSDRYYDITGIYGGNTIRSALLRETFVNEVNVLKAVEEVPNPSGINDIHDNTADDGGKLYNMAGQRVGTDYKGLVIHNKRKYMAK
ncbi:MAG: M6 family metalloprotease domain-containing protein [Prevotella sp.]|nr:M6 family metalloprotease domain-containing protein [Prevotella sp.]